MKKRQINHEVYIDSKAAYELLRESLPTQVKRWWFHAGRWHGPQLPEPKRIPGVKGNQWNLRLLQQWLVKRDLAKFTEL